MSGFIAGEFSGPGTLTAGHAWSGEVACGSREGSRWGGCSGPHPLGCQFWVLTGGLRERGESCGPGVGNPRWFCCAKSGRRRRARTPLPRCSTAGLSVLMPPAGRKEEALPQRKPHNIDRVTVFHGRPVCDGGKTSGPDRDVRDFLRLYYRPSGWFLSGSETSPLCQRGAQPPDLQPLDAHGVWPLVHGAAHAAPAPRPRPSAPQSPGW